MSRKGSARSAPFSTIEMNPSCEVMNKRASPAWAIEVGRVRPVSTLCRVTGIACWEAGAESGGPGGEGGGGGRRGQRPRRGDRDRLRGGGVEDQRPGRDGGCALRGQLGGQEQAERDDKPARWRSVLHAMDSSREQSTLWQEPACNG